MLPVIATPFIMAKKKLPDASDLGACCVIIMVN